MLAALDDELAAVAAAAADKPRRKKLTWSADEAALREVVAETIDRKVDLRRRYEATDDVHAAVKLSSELRLLDATLTRVLKQLKPAMAMPAAPTPRRSQKASQAAKTRWERDAAMGR